jgi:hypothetical protein
MNNIPEWVVNRMILVLQEALDDAFRPSNTSRTISRMIEDNIMTSPFENWQDENRCKAIEYVSEHFNALPYGELGQLIAEQAMDDHRTKITPEPLTPTCDEAFASEAYVRGTAEINSFMGFDYDEATTHGSASDQMEVQDLHNTMPGVVVYDAAKGGHRWYPRGAVHETRKILAAGLQWQIAHERRASWVHDNPLQLDTTLPPVEWNPVARRIAKRRQYKVAAFE